MQQPYSFADAFKCTQCGATNGVYNALDEGQKKRFNSLLQEMLCENCYRPDLEQQKRRKELLEKYIKEKHKLLPNDDDQSNKNRSCCSFFNES